MANPFASIRVFYQETMQELKKSSWPNWLELRESTVVVLIAVIILGIALFTTDWSLFNIVTLFSDLIHNRLSGA